MQSAIELRHLCPEYSEGKSASLGKGGKTLTDRPDAIAELEAYFEEAGRLAPHRTRRISWARLQVLAEFL